MLGEALGRWVAFCEYHPRQVLVVVGLVTALAGAYVWQNFAVDSDLGRLIRPGPDKAWYQSNESFKALFPELQQTSIVVVSGTEPEAIDRTALKLAEAFRRSDRFQFVFAPGLDPFLRDHRAYYLDSDDLDDWVTGVQYDYGAMFRLADQADLSNAALTLADQLMATDGLRLPTVLASLIRNFSGEPVQALSLEAYPHLVPEAGTLQYVIIMLKGQPRLDKNLPNADQVALIRRIIGETRLEAGVRVRLTGEVPLAHEEIKAGLDGISIAGSISLAFLAVVLGVGVRSWRIIAGTFALLGVGVVWTLAFALAAVGALNTLALIFVVMFFGLGVDFAVHFSLRLQDSRGQLGSGDPEVHVVREIGPALALCMLTSSIAFLSFVPTDYRGLAELGIVSCGGMVLAYLLTLTLVPALYSVLGLPEPRVGQLGLALRLGAVRPGLILGTTAVLALLSLWFVRDLRFDYSVLAMRDRGSEAMGTLLELQDNSVTTDYSINVLADNAEAARVMKARLTDLEAVGDVLVPEDLVPGDQQHKADALDELQRLLATIEGVEAGDPAEAAGLLDEALGYLEEVGGQVPSDEQMWFDAFRNGLNDLLDDHARLVQLNRTLKDELVRELAELNRIVSARPFQLSDLPADLLARLITPDGRQLVTIMPKESIDDRASTDAFIEQVMSVTPALAGRAVVEWGVGEVAVEAFLEAVVLSVSLIAIVLVIYFRGIVLPLVVLLPLALTTLFTLTVVELTGLTLNMANILVIPLIFGLGVDTGIHVVHRYTMSGSVAGMLASSTVRAVLISAFTTIGTFFSLSFSPHKGAASIGMLLTVAISIMVLITFLVVPAVLRVLPENGRQV